MIKEMKEIIKKGVNVLLKTGKPDETRWEEFFILITTYLSFNRKIDLNEVRRLSIELSKKYNNLMEGFNRELGKSFDILKSLKSWRQFIFPVNLRYILEEIEELKEYKSGKGSKSNSEKAIGISG